MIIGFDDLVRQRLETLKATIMDPRVNWNRQQGFDLIEAHFLGLAKDIKVRLADVVIMVGEDKM